MSKQTHAYAPAEYVLADVSAIQALVNGTASPEQQKRAVDWIIQQAAGLYEMSYRPGEDGRRDTDFAEGRRFVGSQIVKMTKLDLAKMRRKEPNADPHEPT